MNKLIKNIALTMLSALLIVGCSSPSDSTTSAGSQTYLDKIKEKGKLIVATSPDYAPFEFEDLRKSGQEAYAGSDIDFARYIAEKLGVKLVIEPMAFETVVTAVSEGKADLAISGLDYSEDRAKMAQATKVYYSGETQGIITLKENADKIKTLDDLAGKTVAAQNGSTQLTLAQKQLPDSKIEIITTLNDGVMLLKSGKVDAVALDITTGKQFVRNYPELAIAPMLFEFESIGFVAYAKKGETAFVEEINKIIDEVTEGKKYTEWLDTNVILSEELSK